MTAKGFGEDESNDKLYIDSGDDDDESNGIYPYKPSSSDSGMKRDKESKQSKKIVSSDSEDEIEKSQNAEVLSDSSSSSGGEDRCAICLCHIKEDVGSPDAVGCDHFFCLLCILEWAKNSATCPQDRRHFKKILVRSYIGGNVVEKIPVEVTNEDEPGNYIDDNPVFCEFCGSNEREDCLLLCDGCDLGYHLECLSPPLSEVPIEEWFCPTCVAADLPQVISLAAAMSQVNSHERPTSQRQGSRRLATNPGTRMIPRTLATERVLQRITVTRRKEKKKKKRNQRRRRRRIPCDEDRGAPVQAYSRARPFGSVNDTDIDAIFNEDAFAEKLLNFSASLKKSTKKLRAVSVLKNECNTPSPAYMGRSYHPKVEASRGSVMPDILSNILDSQTVLLTKSSNIVITGDRKLKKLNGLIDRSVDIVQENSILSVPLPSSRMPVETFETDEVYISRRVLEEVRPYKYSDPKKNFYKFGSKDLESFRDDVVYNPSLEAEESRHRNHTSVEFQRSAYNNTSSHNSDRDRYGRRSSYDRDRGRNEPSSDRRKSYSYHRRSRSRSRNRSYKDKNYSRQCKDSRRHRDRSHSRERRKYRRRSRSESRTRDRKLDLSRTQNKGHYSSRDQMSKHKSSHNSRSRSREKSKPSKSLSSKTVVSYSSDSSDSSDELSNVPQDLDSTEVAAKGRAHSESESLLNDSSSQNTHSVEEAFICSTPTHLSKRISKDNDKEEHGLDKVLSDRSDSDSTDADDEKRSVIKEITDQFIEETSADTGYKNERKWLLEHFDEKETDVELSSGSTEKPAFSFEWKGNRGKEKAGFPKVKEFSDDYSIENKHFKKDLIENKKSKMEDLFGDESKTSGGDSPYDPCQIKHSDDESPYDPCEGKTSRSASPYDPCQSRTSGGDSPYDPCQEIEGSIPVELDVCSPFDDQSEDSIISVDNASFLDEVIDDAKQNKSAVSEMSLGTPSQMSLGTPEREPSDSVSENKPRSSSSPESVPETVKNDDPTLKEKLVDLFETSSDDGFDITDIITRLPHKDMLTSIPVKQSSKREEETEKETDLPKRKRINSETKKPPKEMVKIDKAYYDEFPSPLKLDDSFSDEVIRKKLKRIDENMNKENLSNSTKSQLYEQLYRTSTDAFFGTALEKEDTNKKETRKEEVGIKIKEIKESSSKSENLPQESIKEKKSLYSELEMKKIIEDFGLEKSSQASKSKHNKLILEAKVVDEAKRWLNPYYQEKQLSKEAFKEIITKIVKKVLSVECSLTVDPKKIRKLVDGYVKMYIHRKKKEKKELGSD